MSLETLPNMPVGGWRGWSYAVGSAMLLQNSGGESIAVYCILDSDYHSPAAVSERLQRSNELRMHLHIWSIKEIENYLLVPSAIARVINARSSARTARVDVSEIANQLGRICEALRDIVFDAMAAELLAEDRSLGAGGANRVARQRLESRWHDRGGRLAAIPGKQAFSMLSAWSQEQFGVSLGALTVARALTDQEVHPEIRAVIAAIEEARPFDVAA